MNAAPSDLHPRSIEPAHLPGLIDALDLTSTPVAHRGGNHQHRRQNNQIEPLMVPDKLLLSHSVTLLMKNNVPLQMKSDEMYIYRVFRRWTGVDLVQAKQRLAQDSNDFVSIFHSDNELVDIMIHMAPETVFSSTISGGKS